MKDAFPLNNDRSIQFKYVIASNVLCSQKQLADLVQKWITLEHPNVLPLSSGQTVDLKVQTLWDNVAHSYRVFSAAYVSAKSETFVEFKENRLRITVTVSHYVMGAASPFQINSDTPLVGDCYPFAPNGKWKNVLVMAYINSNQKALDQVAGLLNYLNRHTATPSKADKDWSNLTVGTPTRLHRSFFWAKSSIFYRKKGGKTKKRCDVRPKRRTPRGDTCWHEEILPGGKRVATR